MGGNNENEEDLKKKIEMLSRRCGIEHDKFPGSVLGTEYRSNRKTTKET